MICHGAMKERPSILKITLIEKLTRQWPNLLRADQSF